MTKQFTQIGRHQVKTGYYDRFKKPEKSAKQPIKKSYLQNEIEQFKKGKK